MSASRSSVWWCASALVSALSLPAAVRAGAKGEPGVLARGAEIFAREWVPGDPRGRGGDGLGPVFNDTSCVACHGLGSPGGAGPVNKNAVILSLSSTGPAQRGGPTVADAAAKERDAAIHPGFRKARSVVLHRSGVEPEYAGWLRSLTATEDANDGAATVSGVAPRRQGRKTFGKVPGNVAEEIHALARESASQARTFDVKRAERSVRLTVSERNTPALFGAGLLDAVPVEVLTRTAEKQEGSIRGRVHDMGNGRVGRFGWKAQTASLREFVLVACAGELGLEVPGQHQAASPLTPDATPKGYDLSQADCDALIAYVRSMPAPVEVRPNEPQAAQVLDEGRALFASVGCAGCHTPDLGDLKGVYSDMLLHSMGQSLNDGGEYYGDATSPGTPSPSEWRTPPLWGFRDTGPYLHDGRARTLDEAVAHHYGGQGGTAAGKFFELSAKSRLRIQSFLKSLVAPPADPAPADQYASAGEARASQRRRAEVEAKLLDEALAEQRRAAAEDLAEARRVADASRAEIAREAQKVQDEARKSAGMSLWRAETKLRSARDLERAGKTQGALTFYREIVRDFRDTAQAQLAAARVSALAP